jgi:hypothetical protein
MRLGDIVSQLESADPELCIVAKQPWSRDSEAMLIRLTDNFAVPNEARAEGYEYFLEVNVALEDALPQDRVKLSPDQRFDAVLHYALHDAYPTWLNELAATVGGSGA